MNAEEESLRLDQLLSQINEVPSRSAAQRWIKQQHVQINQTPADSPSRILRPGELLEILIPPPKTLDLKPESGNLNILYEDQDLIVLVKPAGLVVHPSPGHDSGTLVNFLLDHCTDLSGIGGVTRQELSIVWTRTLQESWLQQKTTGLTNTLQLSSKNIL